MATSRARTLASLTTDRLREVQPYHPASVGADTKILRPGSRDTTPAEAAEGWYLPPFGKSKHPQTPAAAGSLSTV